MSTIKCNNAQLGQSVTATNNFTLYQPASPDGTVRLGNGNAGSVTDLVTLTSAGNLGIGTSSPTVYGSYKTLEVRAAGGGLIQIGTGATTGALLFSDGAQTQLVTLGATPLGLGTNSVVRATLDASGNLGLGITPSYRLDVAADSGAIGLNIRGRSSDGISVIRMANNSNAEKFRLDVRNDNTVYFQQGGTTQAMTLDASGNLGIGAASVGTKLSVTSASAQVAVGFYTPCGSGQTTIALFQNTTNNGYFTVIGSGASSAVPTWIDGSFILEGVPYSTGNTIISSYSGALTFQTGSRTERARITSDGNLLVGTTAAPKSGANTKVKVANAAIGGITFSGIAAVDTGISVNSGGSGNTLIILASCNYSSGTNTRSAVYIISFYFDGNNTPAVTYLGGAADFLTFAQSATNTLTVTNSTGGNAAVSWFSCAG